jgi:hypothetical protein
MLTKLQRRIVDNVQVTAEGCWIWQLSRNAAGYPRIMIQNDLRSFAHRVSYEEFVGPIPSGLVLDHLCRNPPCVNPTHLEPVTHPENVRRGIVPARNRPSYAWPGRFG